MKNKEKFEEDIIELAINGKRFGVDKITHNICSCSSITCQQCLFEGFGEACGDNCYKWANEEYVEPPKITIPADTPIDAKILVSNDGEIWVHRYFARFEKNRVFTWDNGCTSWTTKKASWWKYAKLPEGEE